VNNEQASNGQYLVLIAAFFFGLNPFFGQLLFQDGLGAEVVSVYRFIIPAVLFAFFLPTRKENRAEARRTLLLGIMSGIGIYSFFHALQVLPPASVILIYYTYPVFSVLIGWAIYKRTPSQNTLISAALIAIAASLTVRPATIPSHLLPYLASCFLAPIVVAAQVQYLSKPQKVIPTTNRMAWISIGHIIVLLPIAGWTAPAQIFPASPMGWAALIGITVFAAAIPQIFFLLGAPKTHADRTALLGSLELLVALLAGAVLLAQQLNQFEITAMLLMVLALFIKQVKEQPNATVYGGKAS